MAERKLNKEQLEAVRHESGPILIIAGAGTGKTTVITERIKYLILEKNLSPENILALTFTEKASQEMQERVDASLPYGYTQMWISTFHAFCDSILRTEAIHIGLNPSYKLMTEAESIILLRKNLFKLNLSYFRPLGNPNKFIQAMLFHFSRLRDEDISPDDYLSFLKASKADIEEEDLKKLNELANAFKIYEKLKVEGGYMDFSDLISNTLLLFRTRPNILSSYQTKFKYVLVDEFQDTNHSQNQLAIMLAGKTKNITVVGDDDQAIYRWRGAAISNIIQFKKEFPKARIVALTKNYRSSQEILDKAYKVIQNNNPDRLEFKEKLDKKLTAERGVKGDPIELIISKRGEDEAQTVADKIKALILRGDLSYKDIAILVRANDHSNFFVRAFERNNIPYQFLGPGQLFKQEEIKDLIAYLKVLYNFEDSTSLYRVLVMEIFDIPARDLAALLNYSRKNNLLLFEALKETKSLMIAEQTKETLEKIYKLISSHLDQVSKSTAGQILYYFLQDSGYLNHILSSKSGKSEKISANFAKFFDRLKSFEFENEDSGVFAVVDWIELSTELKESPLSAATDWGQNDAVNILTVHSSKGLEFKVVFLVNLVEQRFPQRERREQLPLPDGLIKEILPVGDYHLQEERRLFYVGITRARDLLFLTASNFYTDAKRERKISRFIEETLGKSKIDHELQKLTKNISKGQLDLLEWEEKVDKEIPISVGSKIDYISYSHLQTFEICPLHYKLKYMLRIPTPPSASQSYGITLHSALRDLYSLIISGQKVDLKKALELLDNNWTREGYQSKNHEQIAKEGAINVLDAYLKSDLFKNSKPLAVEIPFNFNIENIRVGGRIDRLDQLSNNAIEIVDYKTGNKIPTQKEIDSNLQLTTYALAATEIQEGFFRRKPEEVVLSLYFLEQGQKITTTRSKDQLIDAKKEIIQRIVEIEASDFKCSGNLLCANCEYKMICSTIS